MEMIQNLLSQVSIIARKNAELLEASGGNFNMFSVLGVDHYEQSHSAILVELLNPRGSHGLKSKFLQAFLNKEMHKDFLENFDFPSATVKPEFFTGNNGRIDILIEDNKGHAVIIENKIYAVDQWEQLKRYNYFAIHKYGLGNYEIIYLTLNGKEASDHSGNGVEYRQISYSKDIIDWLDHCVSLSSRFPLVRETINQYINHIKKLTNQDMDTKNSQEILELLSKNEYVDAALTIGKNYSLLCKSIIEDIIKNKLRPQIERFAFENHLIIYILKGEENAVRIYLEKKSWEKCRLTFNTEDSNLYGFTYKDANKKIDNSINEEIRKQISRSQTSHVWPIWIRRDNYKNINIDIWRKDIKNGDFGDYVIGLFSELLKVVENYSI
jgi:hypothetical protein